MRAIRYYRKEGNIAWFREEPYDVNYGSPKKSVLTDYKLGVLDPNSPAGFSISWAALERLRLPIWGAGQNQPFSELIPPLPALPPQTLKVSTYDWKVYDRANGMRPTEYDTYECGKLVSPGSYMIMRLPFFQESDLDVWDTLQNAGYVTHYRKINWTNLPVVVPNPAYQPAWEQQQIEKAELEALLKENLIITASHTFPSMPLNEILSQQLMVKYNLSSVDDINPLWLWKWEEAGDDGVFVKIDVDPNHPLAVPGPSGGFFRTRKPIFPNPDLGAWDTAVSRAIGNYTPDQKLKRILGL